MTIAGSGLWVFGMNSILIPNRFISGGVIGIALLVHYLIPFIGFIWIFLALNIPLLVLGWRTISRQFMLYSIFGMGAIAWMSHIIKPIRMDIKDPIVAALTAGVICGFGAGLVLRSHGSGGGLDILSIYLKKRFGFQVGTTVTLFNALVLMAGVYFYSLQLALYSLIFLFTTGRVINAVISGFNRRKAVLIVSDKSDLISDTLLREKKRGVTLLKGEGGFSHKEKNIIFTIISMIELPKIKEIILNLDPDAFIVVNDTFEVLGRRQENGFLY
jgi:uncharacterized membrane-anchored protein YitT (DUF2179 family)